MTISDLDRTYEDTQNEKEEDDLELEDLEDLTVALQLLEECLNILSTVNRLNRQRQFLKPDQWRELTNTLHDVSLFCRQFDPTDDDE